jgi:hypothetical protein
VELVLMAHQHHASTVEGFAQFAEGVLDRRAVTVGGLLQLAKRERAIGGEKDRFYRRLQVVVQLA